MLLFGRIDGGITMFRQVFLLVTAGCALSGCALINSRAADLKGENDRLLIWKSNYSAGLQTKNGTCAQGALTALATSLKGGLKIQGDTGAATKGTGELSFGQQQALAMINASNAQTAYANIAFFYLCQISANYKGILTADQIIHMWDSANKAVSIVSVAGTIASNTNSVPLTSIDEPATAAKPDAGSAQGADAGKPPAKPANNTSEKTKPTNTVTNGQPAPNATPLSAQGVVSALQQLVAEPSPTGNKARTAQEPLTGSPSNGADQPSTEGTPR
jgi:hypothetical protein